MTDTTHEAPDDLVKRLRKEATDAFGDGMREFTNSYTLRGAIHDEAADRIEELEKACAEWAEVSKSNYQRAKVAEVNLAKAADYVWDTITDYIETCPRDGLTAENTFSDNLKTEQRQFIKGLRLARLKARKALAEPKGQDDE